MVRQAGAQEDGWSPKDTGQQSDQPSRFSLDCGDLPDGQTISSRAGPNQDKMTNHWAFNRGLPDPWTVVIHRAGAPTFQGDGKNRAGREP